MKFSDIPQLTRSASYRVHQSWSHLKETLERYKERYGTMAGLDLNPDFQRGHVWTKQQQIDYVEFKLKGGEGSDIIFFNCTGWMNKYEGPFVLVDGKQRLTAVQEFMENKLRIFKHLDRKCKGFLLSDFEDKMHSMNPSFIFCVNDLPNMDLVLQWYLELNSGGTPHTKEELGKVRAMLKGEKKKAQALFKGQRIKKWDKVR